jgi:formate dehydrogenase
MIMAKVLCVLYPDPTTGYPPKYARHDIPVIKVYLNGQTLPSASHGAGVQARTARRQRLR